MVRHLCLSVLVGAACLGPWPTLARETVPGARWQTIKSAVDTVGTCSTDEFSEIRSCYLIRCAPEHGLMFVVREPDLAELGVRKVELTVAGHHHLLLLEGEAPGERSTSLADKPALLQALSSGATWARFETVQAQTDYATGFDLTGARDKIRGISARCASARR